MESSFERKLANIYGGGGGNWAKKTKNSWTRPTGWWLPGAWGEGKVKEGYGGWMVMDGDLPGGGEHTIQCKDDVL